MQLDQPVEVGGQVGRDRAHLRDLDTRPRGHQVDPALLVQRGHVGDVAVGAQLRVIAEKHARGSDDRRRVDASGELRGHRHVASQVELDALEEEVANVVRGLLEACLAVRVRIDAPVAGRLGEPRPIEVDLEEMGGRELADLREERPVARVSRAEAEVVDQALGIDAPADSRELEERSRLRAERDAPAPPGQVERLDPEGVAGQQEAARADVEVREGEHPDEALEDPGSPFVEPRQQHLRVGARAKAPPQRLELGPKLEVVRDLAVEDDEGRAVHAGHRLPARLRRVEDREAPAEEEEARPGRARSAPSAARAVGLEREPALVVRPPVGEAGEQIRRELPVDLPGLLEDEARDAAHQRRRRAACA